MKVILLQDVPGTGKKNQVLNVSDGFARNYLLPRKWAVEASEGSVKEIERRSSALRQRSWMSATPPRRLPIHSRAR